MTKPNKGDSQALEVSCEFCSRVFTYNQLYYKHVNRHHVDEASEKWVSCAQCPTFFPTEYLLSRHSVKAHSVVEAKDKTTACPFCTTTFTKIATMSSHCNVRHMDLIKELWLPCGFCSKFLPTEDTRMAHQKALHPSKETLEKRKPPSEIRCEYCEKIFFLQRAYLVHANKDHLDLIGDKWAPCPECGFYLQTEQSLQLHRARAHKVRVERKMSCSYCITKFANISSLIQHLNKTHKSKVPDDWVRCPLCPYFTPCQDDLKKHNRLKHKDDTFKKPVRFCVFCPYKTASAGVLLKHCNQVHAEEVAKKWIGCVSCPNFYPTNESLHLHVTLGHRELNKNSSHKRNSNISSCQWCPKVYKGASAARDYYKHANDDHRDNVLDSWFLCDICLLFLPSKTTLSRHRGHHIGITKIYARKKTKVENIQCAFCNVILNQAHNYHVHANGFHKESIESLWIPCSKCDMLIPDEKCIEQHLKTQHMRRGTPYPPNQDRLSCQFCTLSFTRKSESYLHSNKDHKTEVENIWMPCAHCDYFLPTEVAMKTHLNYEHNIRRINKDTMFECDYCVRTYCKSDQFFNHNNRHHFEQVQRDWQLCTICQSYLPDSQALKLHRVFAHRKNGDRPKKERVQCNFCPESFCNKKRLTKHSNHVHLEAVMKAGWKICQDCQAFFPDEDMLKNHNHHDYLSKSYNNKERCPICLERFETQEHALAHAHVAHPEVVASKWYLCDLCRSSLPSKLLLRRHNAREHNIHTCFICLKNFSTKHLYFDHANRLHRTSVQSAKCRWVKCRKCDVYLPNEDEALEHQSSPFCIPVSNSPVVYTKTPPRRRRTDKGTRHKKMFLFQTKSGQNKSKVKLLPDELKLENDTTDSSRALSRSRLNMLHVCSYCDSYFSTRQQLREHFDQHRDEQEQTDSQRKKERGLSDSLKKRRIQTEEIDKEDEPLTKKPRRNITPKSYKEFDVFENDFDENDAYFDSKETSTVVLKFPVKDCSVRISDRYLQLWKQCPDCFSFVRTSKRLESHRRIHIEEKRSKKSTPHKAGKSKSETLKDFPSHLTKKVTTKKQNQKKLTQNMLTHPQPDTFQPSTMIFVEQPYNALPFPGNSDPLETSFENHYDSSELLGDTRSFPHQHYLHSTHEIDSNTVASTEVSMDFQINPQSSDYNVNNSSSRELFPTAQLTDSSVTFEPQQFKPEVDLSNSNGQGFYPYEIKLEEHTLN